MLNSLFSFPPAQKNENVCYPGPGHTAFLSTREMSAAEALQQEIKQQGEVVKNLKAEKKVSSRKPYYQRGIRTDTYAEEPTGTNITQMNVTTLI